MELNKYQTPIEELGLEDLPKEIQDQFWEYFNSIPYIRNLVNKDRLRACDLERDEDGKIIVDVTNPHILEDMDYFRPTAITFQKTGKLTELQPNGNPNSDYYKWAVEEVRRCREGYVRPSDGEWITGDYYYFLNYCPMLQSRNELTKLEQGKEVKLKLVKKKGKRRADRISDFPKVWEGHYLISHYLEQARDNGNHAAELASRGKGKSYFGASLLSKRFELGESEDVNREVQCVVTAYEKKYISGANQILDMFKKYIDFAAINTQWPSKKLINSTQNLQWKMGYKDLDTEAERGTLNSVIGITSKDDESKLRGSRGVLYLIEEAGSFPRLLGLYSTMRPSVEDGEDIFGLIFMYGTAGDESSDFASLQEIMYNPRGYNMYPIKNVYDKEGQGRKEFTYFFPGYINMAGCYNQDGVSDVTKALLIILKDRYTVKYNSSDINAVTKRIAEIPITPQEAIIKSRGSLFPITELSERLNQIDNDTRFYDEVYIGQLVSDGEGVKFVPTNDIPIREYPLKDNKDRGAIEIYKLPENDSSGKPIRDRYIICHDPVDDDEANTMSLTSTFVIDLFTDQIVAEYTGRQPMADDNYEIVRKLCIFYNAKCLYEAHPYSQKVITPNGIKLWGDVKVGDELFSTNGRIVKVTDIPIDEKMPIYKVTLKDGRTIRCSGNHIWNVYKYTNPKNTVNITTQEMLISGVANKYNQHKFFIPNGGAVEFPHREVPIDPYTLGLLIAEGAFTKFKKQQLHNKKRRMVQFSSCVEDCSFYKTVIPYEIKKIGKDSCTWHMYIENIYNILSELGLIHTNSHTKFIPEIYLRNDYNSRMELLKGLMDGDGYAGKTGASIYVTSSESLKNNFMELCRSLGINCSCKYQNSTNSYRISIYTKCCLFKLPRKANTQYIYKSSTRGSKANSFIDKTAIVSIEEDGIEMGKCVTVDKSDGLYLIGDYVVTHNCNKKGIFAYFDKMNCLWMLADTPEYLRDKDIIKSIGIGNKSKGVNATAAVNNYANRLIREWLLKPVTKVKSLPVTNEDGIEEIKDFTVTEFNLYNIKSRALLKELILFNPDGNFDRIRALGIGMIYREEFMIKYGGDVEANNNSSNYEDDLSTDPLFTSLFTRDN